MQHYAAFDATAVGGDLKPRRARGATCERTQNPKQARAPCDVAHNPVFQGALRILPIKEGAEQAQSRLSNRRLTPVSDLRPLRAIHSGHTTRAKPLGHRKFARSAMRKFPAKADQ